MANSATIIIPAFNEAKNLPRIFEGLDKWRLEYPAGRRVVVVNDGSKDETYNVAKSCPWVEVINSSEDGLNIGKGGAFTAGVKYAYKTHAPHTIIAFDGDATHADPLQLNILEKDLLKSGAKMVIAPTVDATNHYMVENSGQRAILTKALMPLIAAKSHQNTWRKAVSRFGLEAALNTKFGVCWSDARFFVGPAFRNATRDYMNEEFAHTKEFLIGRQTIGNAIRSALNFYRKGHHSSSILRLKALKEALRHSPDVHASAAWHKKFSEQLTRKVMRIRRGAKK